MHLIFLVTAVLMFSIVVEFGSVVVAVVLGTAAELGLFTLIVAVIEVGVDVAVLAEVTWLVTKITLPSLSATVLIIASPAVIALVVVTPLSVVVGVIVDRWVDVLVDGWVGILVHHFFTDWLQLTSRTVASSVVGFAMLGSAPRVLGIC